MTVEAGHKLMCVALSFWLSAATMALPRDKTEYQRFRKDHACPSTGHAKGACPGYQVDHKKALMNGGEDSPSNMEWVERSAHKNKTKQDIAECKASHGCRHRGLKINENLPIQPH